MVKKNITNISKFVLDFIESNQDKNLIELWNSDKTQKNFNRAINSKNDDKPKKAKSSYIYFCEEYRDKIKLSNPKLSNRELLTKMGSEWAELKEHRKDEFKKYENMAKIDKERYDVDKASKLETKGVKNVKNVKPPAKPDKVDKPVVDKPVADSVKVDKIVVEDVKSEKIVAIEDDTKILKAKEYFIKKKSKKLKKTQPELNDQQIKEKVNKKWDKLDDENRKIWLDKVSV